MTAFEIKLNGPLFGLMQWADWDRLEAILRTETVARWHVSAVGADAPVTPIDPAALHVLLDGIGVKLQTRAMHITVRRYQS
jgi:hypothetical protein